MNLDKFILEIEEKYEKEVLKNLDIHNINRIIEFLKEEKVTYIDELLTDYLDLFLIDSNDFKNRFYKLKEKYGNNLVEIISYNMNILEEMLF